VLIGATAINEIGSESQKLELLSKIIAGELLLALALDEQATHSPSNITTTATKTDEIYLIQGEKTFVLDGHVADKLIVATRTAGETDNENGITLFLVDSDSPGLEIKRTLMVDNRNSAQVHFDNVKVPSDAMLGGEGNGFIALDRVLDIARIGIAAEMLGSIQEVFDRIIDYLKQREQFGVLIGSFQGLQHRAATMYSEIELCKSIVRAALAALDNPDLDRIEIAELASIAKAKLSEVYFLVSNEGVQMHGGIGMTDEFDIGFFIKRARVAQQFLGDATFHRDRYATLKKF
jgi:acyl-CoA dehydrogenase